jgi:hypothetical protein
MPIGGSGIGVQLTGAACAALDSPQRAANEPPARDGEHHPGHDDDREQRDPLRHNRGHGIPPPGRIMLRRDALGTECGFDARADLLAQVGRPAGELVHCGVVGLTRDLSLSIPERGE